MRNRRNEEVRVPHSCLANCARQGGDFDDRKVNDSVCLTKTHMSEETTLWPVGAAAAVALMVVAANSFLRYLWWTACYSAWSGIPKLHNQWLAAGSRASLNGWSVIILALGSTTVLFTLLRPKSSDRLGVIASVPRLILAAILTIAGTAFFALVLSWVKQGIR